MRHRERPRSVAGFPSQNSSTSVSTSTSASVIAHNRQHSSSSVAVNHARQGQRPSVPFLLKLIFCFLFVSLCFCSESVGSSSSQSGRNSIRERRNSLVLTPSTERHTERSASQERGGNSREMSTPTATSSTPGDQPQPFIRRRSARHRNYLNRGYLHQAVQLDGDLPAEYGMIGHKYVY